MNILLADDDDTSRDLMRRVIRLAPGHTVSEATDGEEAWDLLANSAQHFDLALLDVTMPRLDGIGVLERIRADSRLANLPVILCTAMHDRETVGRAVKLAVTHYIVKPYTREHVLAKLSLVEASLSEQAVEASSVVEKRLGITAEDVRELIGKLKFDVAALHASAQGTTDASVFRTLAVRANGLKGASLNVGLRKLGQELDRLETVFRQDFGGAHRSQFPLTSSEVRGALEGLAAELARVEGLLRD